MKITKYHEQQIIETPHKIDVREEVCEADTLIERVHYISNDANSFARILVVKAPRPVSLTKVL